MCLRAGTSCAFADACSDECEHHGDEGICGQCEEDSRLTHAAQVHDGEQQDEEQRKAHLVRGERRHGGGQGEDTGRDRNGNGEDVVDEQRRGGDEARQGPEILFRDDVCPAARLVRLDGLDVGEHDDREHCRDGQRDRQDEVGGSERRGDENRERRFRGVRNRGERVRREDRQSQGLRQQRFVDVACCARRADDDSLQRVEALTPLCQRRSLRLLCVRVDQCRRLPVLVPLKLATRRRARRPRPGISRRS